MVRAPHFWNRVNQPLPGRARCLRRGCLRWGLVASLYFIFEVVRHLDGAQGIALGLAQAEAQAPALAVDGDDAQLHLLAFAHDIVWLLDGVCPLDGVIG